MASCKKRPDGQWRARYRDEAGKEHARHFARKIDGQKWLDQVTASVVTGTYVDPMAGRVTFRRWFEEWAALQDWAAGTTITASLVLESVTFADVPMHRINEHHVKAWLKAMTLPGPKRKGGLASSTRRTRFNYVRMAFAAAVRLKIIREDPTAAIDPPKVPKSETKMTIPTAEQVGRSISAAPEGFRAFVGVCAFAGLRLGEAAGLQLGDVDFLRRTLTVERQIQGQAAGQTTEVSPKYESARTVYLPEELVNMLSRHVELNEPLGDERWVFQWSGNVLNRNSAGNQWRRLREQVGLEKFTVHDLRHFYASGLIAAGIDVVSVQHALGHSSPSVTLNTYSHLWPKAEDRTRAAAAGLMDSALADSWRTEGRL